MPQINANWFPGHMKKALNNLKDIVPKCDGVISICDSRAPLSSISYSLNTLCGDKEKIIIYSKSDLTDMKKLNAILERNKDNKTKAFIIDLKKKESRDLIISYLEKLETDKDKKFLSLNFPKPSKYFVVLGIPNVGKSTLINLLSSNKKAKVENKPGLTRSEPLIKIREKLYIYDSPGILEPNYEDKTVMLNLALIGSVKDNIFPLEQLGEYLFNHLNSLYPNLLKTKYQVYGDSYFDFYNEIAKKNKMYLKNNTLDIDRAMRFVINELRAGKIGPLCLDE